MQIDLLSFAFGISLGGGLIGFFMVWKSHFQVEEGHHAVLTRFGAVIRDTKQIGFTEDLPIKVIGPGSHWKKPWDKVITFSTMERVIDLSGEHGGKYAMAADGTVLRLDSKIRFYPKSEDYYSYLFELKNPMGHIRELFTCIIRNEIANFVNLTKENENLLGSYSLIRQERKRLNEQVQFICRHQIGEAYGIQFSGVDLIDIVPPHELESALNGIQNAKTEAETLYSKAEGDARQKLVAAEQGVEIARLRAEAVSIELETVAKTIKKLIIEGNMNSYLKHKKTELVGDSKMLFMQRGELKW